MKYHINMRHIRFFYEDILILYERFNYNIFTRKDAEDLKLHYTLKMLLNYSAVERVKKVDSRNYYKLDRFVVDNCQKFADKNKDDRHL